MWFYRIFQSSRFLVRWYRRVVLFSMFLVVRRTEVIMRFPLFVVLLPCKMYSLNQRSWVHSSVFFSQDHCLTSISRLFLCVRTHVDHSTLNRLFSCRLFLFVLVSLFDPCVCLRSSKVCRMRWAEGGLLQHSRGHATNIDMTNVCVVEKARTSLVLWLLCSP